MAVRGKTTEQRDAEFIKRTAPLREVPVDQQVELSQKLDKARARKAALIPVRGIIKAVLHQLERGEASEGDVDDIRWCALQLRDLLDETDTVLVGPLQSPRHQTIPNPAPDSAELLWEPMRQAEAEQNARKNDCPDDSVVDNHCELCGEFESECECAESTAPCPEGCAGGNTPESCETCHGSGVITVDG